MSDFRIMVCGQVDDGKSTLMSQLLIHSGRVFPDQLSHITQASQNRNLNETSLAYVTDGLKYERDHGVTVDTAYRTLELNKKRIQFIDCPGHTKYIGQLISAASFANAAIVVVDIHQEISGQLKNQLQVLRFFAIKKILFCINKIDLENYELNSFDSKVLELKNILNAEPMANVDLQFIPTSALHGSQLFSRHSTLVNFPCLVEIIDGWAQNSEAKGVVRVEKGLSRGMFLFSIQAIIQKANTFFLFGQSSGHITQADQPFYKLNLNSINAFAKTNSEPADLDQFSETVFCADESAQRGEIIVQAESLGNLASVQKLSCTAVLFNSFNFELSTTYRFKNFYYNQSFKIESFSKKSDLYYEIDLTLDASLIWLKNQTNVQLEYASLYDSQSKKIGCLRLFTKI